MNTKNRRRQGNDPSPSVTSCAVILGIVRVDSDSGRVEMLAFHSSDHHVGDHRKSWAKTTKLKLPAETCTQEEPVLSVLTRCFLEEVLSRDASESDLPNLVTSFKSDRDGHPEYLDYRYVPEDRDPKFPDAKPAGVHAKFKFAFHANENFDKYLRREEKRDYNPGGGRGEILQPPTWHEAEGLYYDMCNTKTSTAHRAFMLKILRFLSERNQKVRETYQGFLKIQQERHNARKGGSRPRNDVDPQAGQNDSPPLPH